MRCSHAVAFHEPLDPRAEWESFHHRWAVAIADTLDRTLPPRFFARVEIHLGREIEADVAEFEGTAQPETNGPSGGVAVQTYAPPAVSLVLPAVYPTETAIQIRDLERGSRLAAVIELASPANKDRPETRRAFAAKVAAYLQSGIGVVVADVIANAHFNLHNELIGLMRIGPAVEMAGPTSTYAVAYRPARRQERDEIDVWTHTLVVGSELPTVPLALRGNGCVPLDLEATYRETCERSRLV
jgi:hypothetical protein